MDIKVININDEEFEEQVEHSSLPVLVDFWAEWCGPCNQLSPVIEEISEDMSGKVKIVKINIDDNPETPRKFGVRGIPTMILFNEGKNIATKVGAIPKSEIHKWLESHLEILK